MIYEAAIDFTRKETARYAKNSLDAESAAKTRLVHELLTRGALKENLVVESAGVNYAGVKRYIGKVAIMPEKDYLEMQKKAMEYDALVARVKALGVV